MEKPSSLSDADQTYLRTVQYNDESNLNARIALHHRFSSSPVAFPDFSADLIEWPPSAEVLECGAGNGRFWGNRSCPRTASLTLTDLSPGMVDTAVERARANGFERVTGRECDVQDLPYDDRSFDVVMANHMLYHVPDPDRAIAELARVLRPDGVLLATTNGHGHMGEMSQAISEVFGTGTKEGLYEVFGIDSGEARLRAQFGSITWHGYDNDLLVDDVAAAVAYGLSYPPGQFATDEQAAAFEAAIAQRFVQGIFRIRTRGGAFVCAEPRRRGG